MTAALPNTGKHAPTITDARFLAVITNPADHVHGTKTGYSYGCRCDRCRGAHRETERALRENRKNGWRA